MTVLQNVEFGLEDKIKIEEIKDDSNQKQKTDDIKSKKE